VVHQLIGATANTNTALAGVDELVAGELSDVGGLIGDYSASRVAMPTRDVVLVGVIPVPLVPNPKLMECLWFSAYLEICRLIRAAKLVEADLSSELEPGVWISAQN